MSWLLLHCSFIYSTLLTSSCSAVEMSSLEAMTNITVISRMPTSISTGMSCRQRRVTFLAFISALQIPVRVGHILAQNSPGGPVRLHLLQHLVQLCVQAPGVVLVKGHPQAHGEQGLIQDAELQAALGHELLHRSVVGGQGVGIALAQPGRRAGPASARR